ncbi:SPOR domain-containing protein [Undibacterium curvum]|uniref:SPOR domain-containing protein n=1 Tax=Undibacterium curvum TaxID=2762294 RepID=A0ABR7A1L6_9BURK|nr:SPOR domain-containing protein [Undibacterium curvum]MBC3930799.1 SPOR domain-containing protein [Undibacterium curvum]
MLRFVFWTLFISNLALAGYQFGLAGKWPLEAREPERLKQQVRTDQLVQISASAAQTSSEPAAAEPEKKTEVIACLELGNFLQSDAAKIEDKLKTMALGDRQSRINISETASHMVFIPSQGSKEGADKKISELKRIGVSDYFVIQDQSNLRWGISLGIFKTEDAAKQHLSNLNNKGVRTARIMPRSLTTNKFAYQLHQVTGDEKSKLDALIKDLPAHEARSCQKTS